MAKINNKTGSSLTLVIPPQLGGNVRLPAGQSELKDEVADFIRRSYRNIYGKPAAECIEIEG